MLLVLRQEIKKGTSLPPYNKALGKPTTPQTETCQDARVRILTRLASICVVEMFQVSVIRNRKKRQNPPIPFLREGADDNIDFQLRDCKRRTKKTFPFLLHVACFAAGNKKRHIPAASQLRHLEARKATEAETCQDAQIRILTRLTPA